MIDKGQWWEFGQDTGVTPYSFTRSALGFLMTTESQDLGLTSHPKDGCTSMYKKGIFLVKVYFFILAFILFYYYFYIQ